MHEIGIFQGRLVPDEKNMIQSFPIKSWEKELMYFTKSNFSLLEWVVDSNYKKNPIISNQGINKIKNYYNEVKINAVCCDFLMDFPLFSNTYNNDLANKIIQKLINLSCPNLNINIIELPLLGKSKVEWPNIDKVIEFFYNSNNFLVQKNIFFALETDLEPSRYSNLLDRLDGLNVFVNYDVGNSAYWNYDMLEEFKCYGSKIGTVHIKDCTPDDYSVKLGNGNVDFEEFFNQLSLLNYKGDFIIQGARSADDISIAEEYYSFVKELVTKYF